jgi:hypothetical protein
MKSDAFRRAVEALDLDATLAQMSPTIVLHSPVKPEPLEGKEAVAALFSILLDTFEDLRFVGEYTSAEGDEVLHFRWRLGEQEVEGIDMMSFDAQGLIEDYTVMIRPLPAVIALRDAVFSQLPKG